MNHHKTQFCFLAAFLACSGSVLTGCGSATDLKRAPENVTKTVADTKAANEIAKECEIEPTGIRQSLKEGRISVKVEGRELAEDEEVAIAGAFSALLQKTFSEMIGEAIQEGTEEMLKQLEIPDDLETKLILEGLDFVDEESLVSVYLFRNGDLAKPATTIELTIEGEPLVRLCRIHAPVQQPFAVVTVIQTVNGKTVISESVLVYDETKGWISRKTKIVKRDLYDDAP